MLNPKRNILRLAVAAALAGGAVGANAALLKADLTAFTAAQVASETPITGITLTGTAAVELTAGSKTTLFAPSAGQNLMVNVSLNNGAKFSGTPSLVCQDAAGAYNSAILNLGGAGSNNAVFTFGSAMSTASVSSCVVSAPALTVTGAHTDVTLSITYTYGTLASSVADGTFVQFQSGLTASKVAGDDVVALVTGGFLNVSGGISTTLVSAGNILWKGDTTAAAASGTLAIPADLGSFLGATSGSVTVGGAALAASKVTGGVFLTNAAGCISAGAANTIATAAGGANPVTFTGLTPDQLSAGVFVCVQLNGTTAVPASSITAQFGGTPLSGRTLPSTSAMTLMNITRNGASTEVLSMPASTNSDAGFLRVTNNSALAGTLTATVYNEAGTALSTLCNLGTLASNATSVFSMGSIETTCAITPLTSGRYRLVLNGAFPTMRAQAMVRAAGVLVNVSSDTSQNGN